MKVAGRLQSCSNAAYCTLAAAHLAHLAELGLFKDDPSTGGRSRGVDLDRGSKLVLSARWVSLEDHISGEDCHLSPHIQHMPTIVLRIVGDNDTKMCELERSVESEVAGASDRVLAHSSDGSLDERERERERKRKGDVSQLTTGKRQEMS